MKVCTKCGSQGPFWKDSGTKDGLSVWCVVCKDAARVAWRKLQTSEERKAQNARNRANQKKHPDFANRQTKALRKYRLKRRYGLTPEQWESLFDSQGRKCAICGIEIPTVKGWSTDHDHANGKHRGILCAPHNAALGAFGDSPDLLRAAAIYLEEWRVQHGW